MLRPPSGKLVASDYLEPTKKVTRSILGILIVGPLPRVRPKNGILALVLLLLVVPLRSEFVGEL